MGGTLQVLMVNLLYKMLLVLSDAKFHVHAKRLNSHLERSTCKLILGTIF